MPTFTKAQKRAVINHVLSELLEDTEDDGTLGPIGKAIADDQVNDIFLLLSYPDDDFAKLGYNEGTNRVPLTRSQAISAVRALAVSLLHPRQDATSFFGQGHETHDAACPSQLV